MYCSGFMKMPTASYHADRKAVSAAVAAAAGPSPRATGSIRVEPRWLQTRGERATGDGVEVP